MTNTSWDWKFVCILLCGVGFFKSMRPSEPFLTNYLTGKWINLTETELSSEVYPVATYTYLAVIFVVLFVTDFLRYKPIIICEALAFLCCYLLLIFGRTLIHIQLVEFFYAFGMSCEIAYYTYMYTKVSDEHYQKVTSYARAAVLTGMFSAGIIGQVLILTHLMDYAQLNYISLGSACITLLLAVCLPRVGRSIYFNTEEREEDSNCNDVTSINAIVLPKPRKFIIGCRKLWIDLRESYKNSNVVKWSIWWAFGTCLNTQVINFIQLLWEDVVKAGDGDFSVSNTTNSTSDDERVMYNGAVESACTLLGAIAALSVGFIPINWSLYGELALAAVSVLDAACLALMAETNELWVAYATYIVFRVAYQLLITIASFQVAKDLKQDTYSLIFGFNTFWALFIQTILNIIVADKIGFMIKIRPQFLVYAGFSLCLGIVFFITSIVTCIQNRTQWRVTQRNSNHLE